jgi:hypothetical protein
MKQYRKNEQTVNAKPMTKNEAEEYMKGIIYSREENGYLVEDEDGKEFWIDKPSFEKKYRIADSHLDRMILEFEQLKERLLKIEVFKLSDEFYALPTKEMAEIETQSKVMRVYSEILRRRIDCEKGKSCNKDGEQIPSAMNKWLADYNGYEFVYPADKCDRCPNSNKECKKVTMNDVEFCLKPQP